MKIYTNRDKILQSVLCNENLIKSGEYNPNDFLTIEDALYSENALVATVGKIIDGRYRAKKDDELYKEIHNYLQTKLL